MEIALERPGAVRLAALPPLGVYVHIPWCVRKCPYCDFNSHERAGPLPEAAYVERLLRDLEECLPWIWGRRASSVFIGGGTPSLFSPAAIDALLSGLRARVPLDPQAEVTLEANPGTVEAARFRGFRDAGVNRISLGVQSFEAPMLSALGRIHSGDEAVRAVEAALASFDNVNVDLMYGLPGQGVELARRDLERAIRLGVPHISAYQLTIEPNTVFWRRPPALPEHDACAEMQLAAEEALGAAGYRQYETSAFARPGRESRHNLNYWRFGDYLGLGAGAHGKVSYPDRIMRHSRARQPAQYLSLADTLVEHREVPARELPFEFMLNALRLVEGFETPLFAERTGLALTTIERRLRAAEEKGLIERDWQRIRPTARGRRFLNDLLGLFLDDGSRSPE
ncbi:MAG TPA: radical SAM family heme chaperone HemW [Burkholderiales bacterium]|nr:radical SAM family heme chaperone HemW [Burkholderiales bacterium]